MSCDPNNSNNPIAVYDAITSLQSPFRRAWGSEVHPVYVQAIDHLPTLLPQEASEEFAAALLPHLREYLLAGALPPVWQRAEDHYHHACSSYDIATGLHARDTSGASGHTIHHDRHTGFHQQQEA